MKQLKNRKKKSKENQKKNPGVSVGGDARMSALWVRWCAHECKSEEMDVMGRSLMLPKT